MTEAHEIDIKEVIRVARGDQAALASLYARYGQIMLALGIKILRNRREAEDVLHDVFVEVWKRAGDYDRRRGTVRTWMFLRMRSRCLDRLKSAAHTRNRSIESTGVQALGTVPHEGDAAIEKSRLHAVLQELPDDQRAVLALGYFEGLSSREIAERLSIPVGTVKSRTASAMSKLRSQMSAAAPGGER